MTARPSIVWFRDDLRLADHAALGAGIERGSPLVLVYVLDERTPGIRPLGGAARWWLHGSLQELGERIASLGSRLILRRGAAHEVIPVLVHEVGAAAVFWNRRYGAGSGADDRLAKRLLADGVEVRAFPGNLLSEPGELLTAAGTPYRVFTPFWRALRTRGMRPSIPAPARLPPSVMAGSDDLSNWMLQPTSPDWAAGLRAAWTPGERAASARLETFANDVLPAYHRRDEPAAPATSLLSPRLRFGELSPAHVWSRLARVTDDDARPNVEPFLRQLGWREFFWHLLFHEPDLATRNHRPAFDSFPWHDPHPDELRAWQYGRTGIPLVDAGMRELWETGAMHNRVRMVAASFLVKNLLVDWRIGERWFWDTLVDADEASNPGNWQWVAGSGPDAAPYFRVFNPVRQESRFDPDGRYVRRWVPELGTDSYPQPIIDLSQSRQDALDAYAMMRGVR